MRRLLILFLCSVCALNNFLCYDAEAQEQEVTALFRMEERELIGWTQRACEWFRTCPEGTLEERLNHLIQRYQGTVEVRDAPSGP